MSKLSAPLFTLSAASLVAAAVAHLITPWGAVSLTGIALCYLALQAGVLMGDMTFGQFLANVRRKGSVSAGLFLLSALSFAAAGATLVAGLLGVFVACLCLCYLTLQAGILCEKPQDSVTA